MSSLPETFFFPIPSFLKEVGGHPGVLDVPNLKEEKGSFIHYQVELNNGPTREENSVDFVSFGFLRRSR